MAKKKKKIPVKPLPVTNSGAQFRQWCWWGTVVFLLILPWLGFNNTVYLMNSQFFCIALIFSLSSIAFWFGVWKGWLKPKKSFLFLCISLLLATTLFATIFSAVPILSIWGAYGYFANGLIYFVLIAYLILWLSSLELTGEQLLGFLQLFLIQSAIILFGILHESYNLAQTYPDGFRAVSVFTNSNYAISYVLLALPLGISFGISFLKQKKRWIFLLCLAHTLASIMAIFYLSPVPVQVLITKEFHLKQPGAKAIAIDNNGQGTDKNTINSQDVNQFLSNSSNNQRFSQWKLGWISGKENLLNGSGPGTGRVNFYNHLSDPIFKGWDFFVASELPHNESLQYFAEQGIPGVLAYWFFWLGSLGVILWRWKKIPSPYQIHVGALIAGIFLYLAFNQLSFAVLSTGILSYVLLFASYSLSGEPKVLELNRWLRPTTAFVSILMLFIGFWSLRYWVADTYAEEAGVLNLRSSAEAQTASETAVAWFPYEQNYERLASGYAFAQYVTGGKTNPLLAETAQDHIQRALTLDPYILRNKMSSALFQYIISDNHGERDQAFQDMMSVVHKSPWEQDFYELVKNVLDARKDLPDYTAHVNTLEQQYKIIFGKQL